VNTHRHIFLSYCRDNKADVRRLREELIAAGEKVWWDQDIMPGQDWKYEIRQAMSRSYAVIICFSREVQARGQSGVFPELLDAIGALRERAPGSIFLIPVRLSECDIPPVEIDATRTLDRINYLDLFPETERAEAMSRLAQAVRSSPLRP
jgi:hypothetical protein